MSDLLDPHEFAGMVGARKTSTGWQANCPAHADDTASLSIAEGDDGRLLVHCHAGCEFHDIIEATETYTPREPKRPAMPGDAPTQTIVDAYSYHDQDGVLQYQVVRLEPKSFRPRRPDGAGGWLYNMKGVTRIPYRLPDWYHEPANRLVFIVEGEKDANAAYGLGCIATTVAGGAAAWRGEMATWFADRKVVIIPDNDEAGEKFAAAVYASLYPIAASVKVVRLPGLAIKGDLSDWIAAGGTKEELTQLVKDTPTDVEAIDWKVGSQLAEQADGRIGTSMRIIAQRRARQLKTGESGIEFVPTGFQTVDRLYGGLETNIVTIIGARPGIGKSTALACLAMGAAQQGVSVLWLGMEDPELRTAEKVLAHELGAIYVKGDVKKVREAGRFDGWEGPEWLDNISYVGGAQDIATVVEWVRKGENKLVLIDYAQKISVPGRNIGEVEHGKIVMDALSSACQAANCAVVLAAQINRKGGENIINGEVIPPTVADLRGSGYWEQAAKCVVLLHRDTMQVRRTEAAPTRMGKVKERAAGLVDMTSAENSLKPNEMLWIVGKNNFNPTGHVIFDIDLAASRLVDNGKEL